MKDVQKIVIVDPSDATREPLRNLLLGVDSVWLEAECSRYEFFTDIVAQSHPNVAIVALDADHTRALQLIGQLSGQFPGVPILAVSGRGDGQSILQALRSGAKEFLTQPVRLEELLTALERLRPLGHMGASGLEMPAPGKVDTTILAVLGTRGGVGCTSLAVNLGCTLAQDPKNHVALIDLDLALGDADVALDLLPDYTLSDVAMNIERLDMTMLRRSLCKHSCGLSLLPHPVQMEDVALIHEEHLQRVIGLLRASYTHLILDLSKRFSPTDLMGMKMADTILLICQLELSSLRNTVRMLMTLGAEQELTNKVKVIMNRVGSDYQETGISLKKAEETIGKPIYWQIPNDSKAMLGSRNAGVPLLQHAPKSKTQQSIASLAQALAGKSAEGEPSQKDSKKRSFFSFR
jgi:pilus assembly protein CpaE